MSSRSNTRFGGRTYRRILSLFVLLPLLTATSSLGQVGHTLSGVGPVDQALAGAGTANPQDFMGALYWNPAAITSFDGTRASLGLQFLMPTSDLNSSVDAGAFGPFGPAEDMSGTTPSNAGPFPIPALGFVKNLENSPISLGISAFAVGGFGTDYAVGSNPITTPQAPNGMGFGAISSQFSLLQFSPTIAYQVSDNVSVGVSPTVNYALLEVAPFPAANPDDANNDGFPTYAAAPGTGALGFGFQAGVQLQTDAGFSAGASFKSTQYFSDFQFDSADELGNPRTLEFGLNYPMIISGGVGYENGPFTALADVRYIDYANTKGFDETGYDQFGAVQGFGWESIMVVALGLQYEVTDGLPLRVGYSYNQNPLTDEVMFFNTPANAMITNRISGGLSYNLSNSLIGSIGAQYGFKNSCEGMWIVPGMPEGVPGTSVESTLQTFFVMAGFEYRFN